ncbi:MAG TPA: alpha/beta hydrolase [Mycobacteriales bacterium]|nr:alpha/beta hydrolase [Mycobacteriales bacterium]
MATLALPGTELHYEVVGCGVPVLLIHGMGLDGRMWADQVAALADVAELAVPDLRGFGRSPRESGVAYSHAADLWALADHLGWDDAVVVGLSMGGMIALETALAAPSRVRSLVVMDGVIDGVEFDEGSKAMIKALFEAAAAGDLDGAKKVWLDGGFFLPARRNPELEPRLAEMVADFSGRDWMGDDPHEPRPKLFPALPRIAAPTTVIVGALDVPAFLDMADVMTARIPDARKVVVPDAGHMVNMEAPEVVNAVLREVITGA